MKILFIGNTRLGDAILSTSILNYYSGSNLSITVVCSPLTENIYKNFSNVKDIIAVNKKKRGMHWLETYSLLERVCWDLVIDLRNSILSRLIRKKNILRIGKVNPYKHRVESLCKLINTNEVISPSIPDSNAAKKEALRIITEKNLVKPILAIAPVTNWQRKNWPLENFILLINSLMKKSKHYNKIKHIAFDKYFCSPLTRGQMKCPTKITLPSNRFHRRQGIYSDYHFDPQGNLIDAQTFLKNQDHPNLYT